MPNAMFHFIARNPAMALTCGGILMLLLSSVFRKFVAYGWILIGIGILLHILWIFAGFGGGSRVLMERR